MNRRECIKLLGGAAAFWSVGAWAQHTIPALGFLRSTNAAGSSHLVAAVRRGLNESALVENRDVVILERYADRDHGRLAALAAELISQHVAVIVANTEAAKVAKAATDAVPIIFITGSDPVRLGLVSSF